MFKAETSAEKQPEGHRKTWGSQGRRRGPGDGAERQAGKLTHVPAPYTQGHVTICPALQTQTEA